MSRKINRRNVLKTCILAMLIALYVVLSAFLKITFIGNIQLDLGYIAFAIALCEFGIYGAPVGAIGCALESLLFSAYGFSPSWVAANAIIGVGCGLVFRKTKNVIIRITSIIVFSAIGLLLVKTIIECALYSIPFAVKIPKNAVAFGIDTGVMIVGLIVYDRIKYIIDKTKK